MPEKKEDNETLSPEELYKLLGKNVKILREHRDRNKKWTQTDLANESGHTQSYISDIENGRARITVDVLMDLCKALKTTPNVLLNKTGIDLGEDEAISLFYLSKEELRKLLQIYKIMSS